ncbi:hemoglobin [Kineosphaera limosa]|uniref:Hemoglobin-like protein n=1 Tax=Kineosphaera limosa NBRC 100340 TaxID=1184609 RepID=K6WXM9_9MICO|nr:globin [Kineosphaera limosa]NYE02744.1 hemoglobin [Kineosphaera limosa]GAB96822.1 hemoglobin-like protein [Kineosphaera limosa NBRC 100340]
MSEQPTTYYEAMGGHAFFDALVAHFYQGVAGDAQLRALYPEEDLAPAQERLLLFLEQYWGGPTTYSDERGHPRLRMRHVPYAVTPTMRDKWLEHMLGGLDVVGPQFDLHPQLDAALRDYLTRAADSMVNSLEGQPAPIHRMATPPPSAM